MFYFACISLAPKGVRAAPVHVGVRVVMVIPLRIDVIIDALSEYAYTA